MTRTRLPVLLLAAALIGTVLASGAADAATTSRLAGSDRYDTAAAVSRATFSPGVPMAYVVTGRNFPDALAAGAAAAAKKGPVLLVDAGRIPAPVSTELTRLQPAAITAYRSS